MSHIDHKAQAPAQVPCAVLTISDTRTEATDTAGAAIVSLLGEAGHPIVARAIVRDEPSAVCGFVETQLASGTARVIIATGGTGISSRDRTREAIASLFEMTLDGFGELFRMLSYEQIGSSAMLSRACAGVVRKTPIFLLPGSEAAVRLAMTKLILPELGHLVREVSR